jgi:5,10-methylenetetrahydrofolate reductase
VRNILTLKGDPPTLGTYPGTSGVFDVDTLGLVKVVAGMNQGKDTSGHDIGVPTNFFIGIPLNHNAEDVDFEIEKFRLRVEAGARFAMTQIAYDVEELKDFLRRLGPSPIPIILGILPLQSFRQAEFLLNEVPGIAPTQEALARMKAAGPNGRREGVKMAQELLREVRALIDGVYIMPSFGRYEVAVEVMEAL